MHQSSDRRQRIAADITSLVPAGAYNLNIEQTAKVLGCHPGHVRNQISRGEFPIETVMLGKRRLVPLTSLIDYLAVLIVEQNPQKPKRGPRTKLEKRLLREQPQGDLS